MSLVLAALVEVAVTTTGQCVCTEQRKLVNQAYRSLFVLDVFFLVGSDADGGCFGCRNSSHYLQLALFTQLCPTVTRSMAAPPWRLSTT